MHGGKKQLVKTRFFWVAAFLTSSVRPTHRTFESKLTTNCVLSLRPVDGARRPPRLARVQCLGRRVLYIPHYEYIEACMASVG